MYYKVDRKSETGQRLQKVNDLAHKCYSAAREVALKYGFKRWSRPRRTIAGGVASFYYEEQLDSAIFKRISISNYYAPKKNTKKGREILLELSKLPTVSWDELNEAVGFTGEAAKYAVVGLYTNNPDFYGVLTDAYWNATLHSDCVEITSIEYNQLFNTAE